MSERASKASEAKDAHEAEGDGGDERRGEESDAKDKKVAKGGGDDGEPEASKPNISPSFLPHKMKYGGGSVVVLRRRFSSLQEGAVPPLFF